MREDRLYTEREVNAILKRAGEMQAGRREEETHGLSLAELQQVAAEVGLDPGVVAAAAAELERSGEEAEGRAWHGLPVRMDMVRVLPGEVSEDLYEAIAAEIGRAFGVVGASGQVGRSLQWTHTSRTVQLQVTLTPMKGQTKVRVYGDFSKRAVSWLAPLVVIFLLEGFFIPVGAGVSLLGSAGVGLGAALLAYLLIRLFFDAYVDRRERAARRLLERLEEMTPRTADAASVAAPETPSAGERIALPDDDVGVAGREATSARRRTRS